LTSGTRGRAAALRTALASPEPLGDPRQVTLPPETMRWIARTVRRYRLLREGSAARSGSSGQSRRRTKIAKLPLGTAALVAGLSLVGVIGFAALSAGPRDQLHFSAVESEFPPKVSRPAIDSGSPAQELKTKPNEHRLTAPIPPEPLNTASISPTRTVPSTVVVASLAPKQSLGSGVRTLDPIVKAPEPPALSTSPAQARPTVSSAEASAYLARAETALRNGDFVGARSLFGRLAEAGDPRGALGMARTYDPAEFKKLLVYGLKPDSAESERWRVRAEELASSIRRN